MKRGTMQLLCGLALLWMAVPARAHIGGKDVFEQVDAGPYRLLVTVRMPTVIPGVATLEVRSSGAAVDTIRITPVPLTGEASKHPPASDAMVRDAQAGDPNFFTGSLWLMASGSWQVRMQIDGAAGPVTAGVPVAAMPLAILPMQRSLGITLAILGVVLTLGMVGIIAAAVREARLVPGVAPDGARRRRAAVAGVASLAFLVFALFWGNKWWKVEAAGYAKDIYQPSDLHVTLTGSTLNLRMGDYNEKRKRWEADSTDNFLLDHGHIMHLYAIRMPGMDAAFHLHPEPVSEKDLATMLPTMPPGQYRLYADLVYRNGFPETLTTELTVPAGLQATPLAPEDAEALPAALAQGELGPEYKLPDGYRMVWDKPAEITANTAYNFHFKLLDGMGHAAADMQPYLGMAGHAAFVKADGTAFAHTHPEGSAAMPAVRLANNASQEMGMAPGETSMAEMPGMAGAVGPSVDFPYGFPSPGRYRIFVQMKHGGTVETGVFDAEVR